MGNLFGRSSAPPQLYARPAAAAMAPATEAEAAALASLASRFPALHARDVDPELLAAPAQLADGVFLGSFEHAKDKEWLAAHSIAAVLNCGPDVCRLSASDVPRDPRTQIIDEQGTNAERRVARARAFLGEGVDYAECDATDVEGYAVIEKHLKDAVAFIRRRKGPVLIHCFSGQNRSAALALGYLMTEQGLSLEQALALAHPLRPLILSNESFRLQLLRLGARQAAEGEAR